MVHDGSSVLLERQRFSSVRLALLLLLNLGASAFNLHFAVYLIPRFRDVLGDFFRPEDVPRLSAALLAQRQWLIVAACAWLLCSLVAYWKSSERALFAILGIVIVQVGTCVYVLISPLTALGN